MQLSEDPLSQMVSGLYWTTGMQMQNKIFSFFKVVDYTGAKRLLFECLSSAVH